MNSSEEICLLTTFAQMAQARRTNVDEDFIKIIVLEIYEVRTLSCKRQLKNIFFWIIHPLILLGLLLKKCDSCVLSAFMEGARESKEHHFAIKNIEKTNHAHCILPSYFSDLEKF